jgi:glyoxylase-like metal-dependent hydrolase (beta-lactamase superfamily II)
MSTMRYQGDNPMRPAIVQVSRTLHRSGSSLLTRRQILLGGLCACCLPALTRAAAGGAPFTEVAPGIFFRRGLDEDATAANLGAIANIGFVIGRASVAVFDPGGSLADGEHLLGAVRAKTRLPIRYVVLSHAHPDHVFGAHAFASEHPEFVGHEKLPGALAARGEYYRKRLAAVVGDPRAGAVVIPLPIRTTT